MYKSNTSRVDAYFKFQLIGGVLIREGVLIQGYFGDGGSVLRGMLN